MRWRKFSFLQVSTMISDITSGVRVYLEYSGLSPVYIRFFTSEFYSEIAIMVAVKLLQLNLKKFCEYLIENSYMDDGKL